jgi:hypothetical protein
MELTDLQKGEETAQACDIACFQQLSFCKKGPPKRSSQRGGILTLEM